MIVSFFCVSEHASFLSTQGNKPIEIEDDPGHDGSDEATEGPVTLNCSKVGNALFFGTSSLALALASLV